MQKLPIGIQFFDSLRKDNFLYIDKTEQIYRLINTGTLVFLLRPRYFGKSLLIPTLQHIFQGHKKLFSGAVDRGQNRLATAPGADDQLQ